MSTYKDCNKYAVIRRLYPDSNIGSVYFKTNKPYVSVECLKDSIVLTGIDELSDDALCFESPDSNMRLRLPAVVSGRYEDFFDTKHVADRYENRTVIHIKSDAESELKLPNGCHYSKSVGTVDISKYQKIAAVAAPTLIGKIRKILAESNMPLSHMTVVVDDDKSYVLIEPLFNTFGCNCEYQEDLHQYFGKNFYYFPKGTLSMLIDNEHFSIPQCFYAFNKLKNYAGVEKTAIYSNGTSFLIAPDDKQCIIDGAPIKATEYRGKDITLCEDCSADEAKAIIGKLLHSIDDLLAENEQLKKTVGKNVTSETTSSSEKEGTTMEKLLRNVDEILRENRLLKKIVM